MCFTIKKVNYSANNSGHMEVVEMRFFDGVNGYINRDGMRSTDVRSPLQVYSLQDTLKERRGKWVEHMRRAYPNRFPSEVYEYKPTGKRIRGGVEGKR